MRLSASPRRLSLGTKLAAFTSSVLVLVSATLFVQLAARERAKVVAAKATAASMVTQIVAIELGAAVDFGDNDDLRTQLNHLQMNPDIVGAAIWSGTSETPTVAWMAPGAPSLDGPSTQSEGAAMSRDWLVLTRNIANREGRTIARLRVAFTLLPENEAFRSSRWRLLWVTAGLTLLTTGLLVALSRIFVIGPVRRLAEAAGALAKGDLSARVDVRSNDEISDLARSFNVMGEAVAFRHERLKKELDLAQHIQMSILPKSLQVAGLELAAVMKPATEVGGDYYDVIASEQGCWIGIGDVAGHGLDTGLIMLMTQAIVSALVRREPGASPRDVVCHLNLVLFENIRNRLEREEHVTLTLLRYDRSGRIVFAGAHEDIVVYRAGEGRCEIILTPGTWLGGRPDIEHATVDSSLQLGAGDLLMLYTDGATELRNEQGEQFGLDRLCEELERLHAVSLADIQAHLGKRLEEWGSASDDVTVLIARYKGA